MYELHVISDGHMSLSQFAEIAGRIHPYVDAIHIREKQRTALEVWDGVQLLLQHGVPAPKITINDRMDVAWASRIGAVHLANHSIPLHYLHRLPHALRIGKSIHSVEEAKDGASAGADYLFFGHVYDSGSKPSVLPRGLRQLQGVTAAVDIPVIAIGGIGIDQIDEVLDHGARGVAVIRSILHAEDPEQMAMEMARKIHQWVNQRDLMYEGK